MLAITACTWRCARWPSSHARISAYAKPRWSAGRRPSSRRCWAALHSSLNTSRITRRQRAGDALVRRVGEVVGADAPRAGRALHHRAHRQQAVQRITPRCAQQAPSSNSRPPGRPSGGTLELRRVLGGVASRSARRGSCSGSGDGHLVVVAVEQARLARAGLRGPVGLPAHGKVGGAPFARGPAPRGWEHAVADRAPSMTFVGRARRSPGTGGPRRWRWTAWGPAAAGARRLTTLRSKKSRSSSRIASSDVTAV